ncbi:MAG TPA: hypothetical protein VM219_08650 [Phycisphaerae bacterium]|nr:hypothetical protein [Phycisphaerae bacterium]
MPTWLDGLLKFLLIFSIVVFGHFIFVAVSRLRSKRKIRSEKPSE